MTEGCWKFSTVAYRGRIDCHFGNPISLVFCLTYGGDDGARTRDLCRDSLPVSGFTTTYNDIESRPSLSKSPMIMRFVGRVVGTPFTNSFHKIFSFSSLYSYHGRRTSFHFQNAAGGENMLQLQPEPSPTPPGQ
jgi:hypothetical protein